MDNIVISEGAVRQVRLNGWQRIGIVISVCWMLFVGGIVAIGYLEYGRAAEPFGERIELTPPLDKKLIRPGQLLSFEEFAGRHEYRFRLDRLLLALLAPVALLWVLSYLSVAVVRWVIVGFRKDS